MKRIFSVFLAYMVVSLSVLPCYALGSQTEDDESEVNLTAEESAYVNAHQDVPLVVAISEDMAPMEYYDEEKGEYSGFIIELYEEIAKKTGLKFTYVKRGDSTETKNQIANGEIQLVGSLSTNPKVAEALNVTTSNPFYTNTVSLVSKNSWTGEGNSDSVVAVKAGYPVFVEIAKSLGYTTIVEYDSFEACIEAVNNDQADITLISTTGENVLLGHSYYGNLTSILLTQTSGDYGVGIANNEDTDILLSIINKAEADISQDWITQTRLQWILKVQAKRTFKDTVYENGMLIFFLLMAIVIAIIMILLLRAKQKRRVNQKLQENNEKLQIALQEKDTALEIAAKANAAKSEFLSNMSHDIRTPMTAILNLTDLTLDEINQPEILKDDLMKIKMSGNYLMGLINDVLDMSRIESGKMVLKPSVYTHADFVGYMDSITTPLCEQKGINFQWDKGSTSVDVYVDVVRFNQVFYNLLSNAIKYTPAGGYVSLKVENNHIENNVLYCDFVIQDTGIGISPEFMKKLYTPFERAENVNAYTGTGLGLSITKQIIDLMHGSIHIDSELGKGTTVTFQIPMPIATEEQRQQAFSSTSVSKQKDELSNEGKDAAMILLAEDNQLNQEIITRLLNKKNYEVKCTSNGADALSAFSESQIDYYDAIIMDIRMPVMNGYEATKAIRALEREDAKTVPIIAMSANAYEEDVRKSLSIGMNVHLSKPIEAEKLYATLSDQISHRSHS